MSEDRRKFYEHLFENADKSETELVGHLIDEAVFHEDRMEELKRLPFIQIHPADPARQRATAAARQYKEFAAGYVNIMRLLLNILRRNEPSAADELVKRLEEFR